MKTLQQHIEEKLIINKDFKNDDDIKKLFDEVKFYRDDSYRHDLITKENIFDIMKEYIKYNNIKCISSFDEYRKMNFEHDSYLVIYNNEIAEMDVFHKHNSNSNYYDVIIIYGRHTGDRSTPIHSYVFQRHYGEPERGMHMLKDCDNWNGPNVEYYEISEKTFNEISNVYKYVSDKYKTT